MITELAASLAAIKESLGLVSVIREAKTELEIQTATYELREKLTALQLENFKIATILNSQCEEIHSLKCENRDLHMNKANLERYTISQTAAGAFIYSLIDSPDNDKLATYYACPNCYHQSKISILQPETTLQSDAFHKVKCLVCENIFKTGHNENYVAPKSIEELAQSLNNGADVMPLSYKNS